MTPRDVREWVRIGRDVLIAGVATFMLIYETVYAPTPNPLLVGAGMTLFGLPVALRLDQYLRNGDEPPERPRRR